MGTTHEYAKSLITASAKIEQIEKDVNSLVGGEYKYKLNTLVKSYTDLFDRFCPFKIGDRVRLTAAPEISKKVAWGLLSYKHFLIPGAIATVSSLDFCEGLFSFGVVFDDESWISSLSGKLQHYVEPADRHAFLFSEKFLELLPDDSDQSISQS